MSCRTHVKYNGAKQNGGVGEGAAAPGGSGGRRSLQPGCGSRAGAGSRGSRCGAWERLLPPRPRSRGGEWYWGEKGVGWALVPPLPRKRQGGRCRRWCRCRQCRQCPGTARPPSPWGGCRCTPSVSSPGGRVLWGRHAPGPQPAGLRFLPLKLPISGKAWKVQKLAPTRPLSSTTMPWRQTLGVANLHGLGMQQIF